MTALVGKPLELFKMAMGNQLKKIAHGWNNKHLRILADLIVLLISKPQLVGEIAEGKNILTQPMNIRIVVVKEVDANNG